MSPIYFRHLLALFAMFAITGFAQTDFSVTPDIVSVPVGEETTFTTLLSVDSLPFAAAVTGTVTSGPNAGTAVNDQGNGVFSYAGANPGTDTVEFTATVLTVPVTATAMVTWIDIECSVQPDPAGGRISDFVQLTATIHRDGSPEPAVTVNYVVTAGPNQGASGSSDTNASGQALVGYTSNGSVGTDTLALSGSINGVAFACPATVNWLDVECSSDSAGFAIVGHEYTHSVSIYSDGKPVPGVNVGFSVSGINSGTTASVMTDAEGDARFAYTSFGGGTDTISATAFVGGVSTNCSTDVQWSHFGCAVAPTSAARQINTPHFMTLTAIVEGSPQIGAAVTVTRVGANGALPATNLTTDDNGQAVFSYTGTNIGEDILNFTVDGSEFCDAIVTWRDVQVSVNPSTAILQAGSDHTLTATVTYNGQAAAGAIVDLDVDSGPNAGPADSATADASGIVTLGYTSNGNVGQDQLIISARHASVGNSTAATVDWKVGACSLSPEDAIAAVDSSHSVDIDVTLGGVPHPGASIDVLVSSGPNAGESASLVSDENGRATFAYTGDGGIGVDTIVADSSISGLQTSCQTTVEWISVICSVASDLHAPVNEVASISVALRRSGVPALGIPVRIATVSGPNVTAMPIDLTTGPSGTVAGLFVDRAGVIGDDVLQISGSVDGITFSCQTTIHWGTVGGINLLPAVLRPTVGSTVAIPIRVLDNGLPADTTVTFQIVAGPNAGTSVPIPTEGNGIAVWPVTNEGLGLSDIRASGTHDGAPFSIAGHVEWIPGPSGGFNPPFASQGSGTHSTTLRLKDNGQPAVGVNIAVGVIAGPNSGTGEQLVTDGNGEITFTYTSDGSAGVDTIIATTTTPRGTASWNALVEWTAIDCNLSGPSYAQVGSPIDIQLDLQREGVPADAIDVSFDVFGPNTGTSGQVTTTNGQATYNYTGGSTTGIDTITASGTILGAPFSCDIQVEWIDVQCELSPANAILLAGDPHTLTASITRNGIPVPGLTVDVSGADELGPARTTTKSTGESGSFDLFVYSEVPEQRTVSISGEVDGVAFACQADVEWIELACSIAKSADPNNIGTSVTLTLDVTRNGNTVTPTEIDWIITQGPHNGISTTGTPTFVYTGSSIGVDDIEAIASVDGLIVECATQVDWRDVSCEISSSPGVLLQIGTEHDAVVVVTEEGEPASNTAVTLTIDSGPNAGFSDTVTTDSLGRAAFSWVGNAIGVDQFTASGSFGVAYSCSSSVEWAEYACSISPPTQQVPTDGQASFVYTLTKNGAPVDGGNIVWAVYDGPNADLGARTGINGSATTNASGEATISYTDFVGGGATDSIFVNFSLDGVSLDCETTIDWLDHRCDLHPQEATVHIGTEHVLTTLVTVNGSPVPDSDVTFSVTAGPHVGATGIATTGHDGIAIFKYTGTSEGTDTIQASGSVGAGTFSCDTTVTWEVGALCTLTPNIAFANVANSHSVTLTLTDDGTPIYGQIVFSVIEGPNSGTTSNATTDISGNASFSYAGSLLGTDTIVATGPSGAVCSAAVTWIDPQCNISLDPSIFGVGSDSLITTQITRDGIPAPGISATLTVLSGPNATTTQTLISDINGDIFFAYTGGPNFGTDAVEISGNIDGAAFICNDSIEWIDVACSVAPANTFQQIGEDQTLTVTLSKNGAPVPGHEVTARRVPGNTSLGAHTTDENGSASVTISNNAVGFDQVYFNATLDGVSTECFGTVNWIDVTCGITAPTVAQIGGNFDATLLVNKNGSPVFEADVAWSILTGPNAGSTILNTVTDPSGQSTFGYASNGSIGTDTILATGTVDGVTYTCTHSIEWVDIQCSLTPLASTMRLGDQQNIGITVTRNGVTVPGVAADFAIETGPHSGEEADQVENFSYTGEITGTDQITASGQVEGVGFSCQESVNWITLAASANQANAKAQINTNFQITITLLKNGAGVADIPVEIHSGVSRVAHITDANGQVTITVNESTSGQEVYAFTGSVDGVSFFTNATVEWIDLQCGLDPAIAFHQIGDTATVDLTLTLNGVEVTTPSADIVVSTGPNAGEVGGGDSFTYTSNGNVGQDTIRAFGTHDGVSFDCEATVDWADVQCSLSPASAIADADGGPHQVELTLHEDMIQALGGKTANFAITSGINNGFADSASTLSSGKVTFSIPNNSSTFGTDNFEVTGDVQGIPFSCGGQVQWLRAECSAAPSGAQVVLGQTHSVTVTILQDGAPAGAGVTVNFSGPVSQQSSTNASGQATVSWSGSGTETLTASGDIQGVPFSCDSIVEWVPNAECAFAESAITALINDDVLLSLAILQDGGQLPGHSVTFTVISGPNTGATASTSTGEDAFADFLLSSNGTIGTDVIEATSTFLGVPFSCQATVEWIDLQCSLVGGIRPSGDTANLTLTVTRNGVPVSAESTVEVIAGPNTGATGDAYASNGTAGTDIIQASGEVDGLAFSCEGQVQWIDYGCDIQPADGIAEASANYSVTATFTRDGVPAAGEAITWQDGTPGITDENGEASITLEGDGSTGVKTLSASAELDGNTIICETTLERITVDCTLVPLATPLEVGGNANLIGTLLRNSVGVPGIQVDFEVTSGPNAGTVGAGTSGSDGTLGLGYQGNGGFGTDTIVMTATIDGVSSTCQATVEWIEVSCDVSPQATEKQIGDTVTFTATITRNGSPATGVAISASSGETGVTDGLGQFSVTVSQGSIGSQTVSFDATVDGIASSCSGQVEWVDVSCELNPPTADLVVGDTSFVNTATIRRNGVAVEGAAVFFGVTAGPNANTNASLVTNASGEASFSYLADGGTGDDVVEIIGDINGVQFTCTATRSYRSLPACTLSPDNSSSQSGGSHSLTVTVLQDGAPFVGDVSFAIIGGPNSGEPFITSTDSSGQASFDYSSDGSAGTDTIEVSGSYAGSGFNCSTTHEWFDVFTCEVSPADQVAQIDSNAQVTVTLLRNGSPEPGGQINGQTTSENGEAVFTFTSSTIGQETVDFIGDGGSQCSATIEWVDLQLLLTPQDQLHAVGDTATFDASITRNGAAVTGETILLSVDAGPNAGHSDSAAAAANFTYPGNGGNGTDQVVATATVEGIHLQANAQAGWLVVDCVVNPPGPQAALGVETIIEGQVTLNGSPAVARDVNFLVTAGPHAGQSGTATTNGQGIATFALTGTAIGPDTIQLTGDISGVPYSCEETLEWVAVPTCKLAPEDAIVGVGESHSIVVNFQPNSEINASVVSGPNTGQSTSLYSDGTGNATFTYTGNGGVGIDQIEFVADFLGATVSCTTTTDWQSIDCQLAGGNAVVGRQFGVTLTLLRNGSAPIAAAIANFAIPSGPNAGETATLQTDGNGQATFTYRGQGGIGQDRVTVMGSVDGINFECEVPVEWLSGIGCTFRPEQASANSCDTQTVRLTVLNDGDPVADTAVSINVASGPHAGFSTSVTTDAQGRGSFDLAGDGQVGQDFLIATVLVNNVQESCHATREWTNDAPVISCPDNITCNSLNPNGGTVWFDVLATDDCDTPTVTCTPPAGSQFPIGSTTVTCTATDSHGASDSCTFTVTITDVIPDELLEGLSKITPPAPVRFDSPLLVDMARAPYETVEVGNGFEYESVRASLQHFFMGKSPLTVGQFIEIANWLFDERASIQHLRFTAQGDIYYGPNVLLFSMADNNNVTDDEGRVLFDYGLRFNGNGYRVSAEFIRVKLFGDTDLPQNAGNPDIQASGTDCDELLAVANFPIVGVSWYGGAFLANAYSRYAKGLDQCDLAYAIGLTAEEFRPNHLSVDDWLNGFDSTEQEEWVQRFPFAYRLPTYEEHTTASNEQNNGGYATHNGGNYFNSDDFFDNGPTPVGYYYALDHNPINDLSGNVWEWLSQPDTGGRSSEFGITGGSWYNTQSFAQIGNFFGANPGAGYADVGLRFVATHDFRFRAYLREASQGSFGPPDEFQGHVYYPNLQPDTDYVWEAEFTHDGLEGALGWIAEPGIVRAEASFSTTAQAPAAMNLTAGLGWNLMSVTIEPALCHSKHLFGMNSTVWAWNPVRQIYEYEPGAVIEPFKGYWVHFPSTPPGQIHGFEPLSTEITLRRFWNLIGPAQDNFSFDDISGRLGPVYGYQNNEFQEADALNIGFGYFIFVSRASQLELDPLPVDP